MEKIAGMPAGFVSMFAVNTLIFTIQRPGLSLAANRLNPESLRPLRRASHNTA